MSIQSDLILEYTYEADDKCFYKFHGEFNLDLNLDLVIGLMHSVDIAKLGEQLQWIFLSFASSPMHLHYNLMTNRLITQAAGAEV